MLSGELALVPSVANRRGKRDKMENRKENEASDPPKRDGQKQVSNSNSNRPPTQEPSKKDWYCGISLGPSSLIRQDYPIWNTLLEN